MHSQQQKIFKMLIGLFDLLSKLWQWYGQLHLIICVELYFPCSLQPCLLQLSISSNCFVRNLEEEFEQVFIISLAIAIFAVHLSVST